AGDSVREQSCLDLRTRKSASVEHPQNRARSDLLIECQAGMSIQIICPERPRLPAWMRMLIRGESAEAIEARDAPREAFALLVLPRSQVLAIKLGKQGQALADGDAELENIPFDAFPVGVLNRIDEEIRARVVFQPLNSTRRIDHHKWGG